MGLARCGISGAIGSHADEDKVGGLTRRMIVSSSMSILSTVMAMLVLSVAPSRAAEELAPQTFVALKFEGACDTQNNRLWLTNTHTFKTVVAKVRWRAAGGKDLTEDFYPAPNSTREIGCAAEAEILEAKFADF